MEDPAEQPDVKQSDFSLLLGPTVVTPDEIDPGIVAYALRAGGREESGSAHGFSWPDALAVAGGGRRSGPGTSSPGHLC